MKSLESCTLVDFTLDHGRHEAVDETETTLTDRVTRTSLSRQIADKLRDDIVHGRIPADTKLLQDELCDRFGTSRMPVRDALQQLTHEGLLELHGAQRVVVKLGADDIAEANDLIGILHAWAAGRAAVHASVEQIDELDELCEKLIESEDPYEFGHLALRFHRQLNFMANSPRLIRVMTDLQRSIPQALPFTIPESHPIEKEDFRRIVNAVRWRDPELAERLARTQATSYTSLLKRSLEGAFQAEEENVSPPARTARL
jgi:DNA-binding GntR family transcriptional regulator